MSDRLQRRSRGRPSRHSLAYAIAVLAVPVLPAPAMAADLTVGADFPGSTASARLVTAPGPGGTCQPRFTGGPEHDTIIANRRDNVICGRGGNDALFGRPGDDILRGARGSDHLIGGFGADFLYGSGGRFDYIYGDNNGGGVIGGDDHVHGGVGRDFIYGGGGRDRLEGGPDNDVISGGYGGDHLRPNAGNDSVRGQHGADTIRGGGGDDWINGNAGQDLVDGGDGADRIYGGSGDDTIYGGYGNDTILDGRRGPGGSAGLGDDTIFLADGVADNDSASCGPGDDLIYIDAGDLVDTDCETVRTRATGAQWPGPASDMHLSTGAPDRAGSDQRRFP